LPSQPVIHSPRSQDRPLRPAPDSDVSPIDDGEHAFEDIVFHTQRGDLLDLLEHPNPDRYSGQRIFIVQRDDYVFVVPFVEDKHTVSLNTISPSRKATKEYLGQESDDEA
jgi:hypothetical protein